jgi:hypothetical protein
MKASMLWCGALAANKATRMRTALLNWVVLCVLTLNSTAASDNANSQLNGS